MGHQAPHTFYQIGPYSSIFGAFGAFLKHHHLAFPGSRPLLVRWINGRPQIKVRLHAIGEDVCEHCFGSQHAAQDQLPQNLGSYSLGWGPDAAEILDMILHQLKGRNGGRLQNPQGVGHHEFAVALQDEWPKRMVLLWLNSAIVRHNLVLLWIWWSFGPFLGPVPQRLCGAGLWYERGTIFSRRKRLRSQVLQRFLQVQEWMKIILPIFATGIGNKTWQRGIHDGEQQFHKVPAGFQENHLATLRTEQLHFDFGVCIPVLVLWLATFLLFRFHKNNPGCWERVSSASAQISRGLESKWLLQRLQGQGCEVPRSCWESNVSNQISGINDPGCCRSWA